MVVKYGDSRSRIRTDQSAKRKSDVLVVVQDGDSEALLLGDIACPEMLSVLYQATGRLPNGMPCRVGRHVQ